MLKNKFTMTLQSRSFNESFVRATVSAFVLQLDPTLEEISDIKTAVSEAVTNCIVHAYEEKNGIIYISADLFDDNTVRIKIRDKGVGIPDIPKALTPLFTTAGDDRSGLGFTVMESFTDKLTVKSVPEKGTTVTLVKKLHRK